MVRKFGVFFILLIILLLCACNASQNNPDFTQNGSSIEEEAKFPYTFTDSTGRKLTLESRPQRVAVLFSSFAEMWKLAGGSIVATVGDSVERGFAAAGTVLVDDGAGLKIDTELLAASKPDFVIASADISAQREVCQRLSKAGIPCAAFTEETVDEYLAILKIFTDITGNTKAYETFGTETKSGIGSVYQSRLG